MAGFNLENMKAMADLVKFIEKFDAKFNSIEDSVKNTSKGMKEMANSAKAMDGSFGGSTGNVGNGTGGSVMSQPSMPGQPGSSKETSGFKAARESAERAYGRPLVSNVPLPGQAIGGVGGFIDTVMNGPIGGIIKPAFLAGYNALPSVEETFQMNTVKNRLRFQGFGSDAQITAMLRAQTGAGTPNSAMDFLGGFADSRQLGSNLNSIARNLSLASNLSPGVGYQGAATALTGLNAPRNVNFLRMLGIQIRDQVTGNMRDLDKIIDDLWSMLTRQVRGRNIPISQSDLRLSLQPGNALATLLDQYFGNDPYLRTIVEDGLYAKAQGVGAADLEGLKSIGARSEVIASQAARHGASIRFMETVSGPMMAGMMGANKIAQGLSNLFNMPGVNQLGKLMAGGKGFLDTFGGMGNESGSMLLTSVGKLLSKIPFLAEGGPTDARNAYVVGEKGPELFVPESDGRIVPHHELDLNNLQFQGFRHTGGKVTVAGPDGSHGHPDVAKGQFHKHMDRGAQLPHDELRRILIAAGFKNNMKGKGGVIINAIDDAMQIIGKESNRQPGSGNFDGNLDMSYGLFQINMLNSGKYKDMGKERLKKFGLKYDWDLYDPLTNARVAYEISSQGRRWHPAWSTAAIVGLAGPWGNPRGNQSGGVISSVEGLFNQFTEKTGIVGTGIGAVGGAAGNVIGNIKDFISSRFQAASEAQAFLMGLFNMFKDIPGFGSSEGGKTMNPYKSNAIPDPANYREHGGAVSAMGVNYGGRGQNINYGGVTVKIVSNKSWDERKLAQEIRKTLEYDTLMKRAVSG